jgi:hypothetical protein
MPMASFGPKASTHNGVVSIPNPPPKPAFDRPMNSTATAASSMEDQSCTRDV